MATFEPIGFVRSPFKEKREAPRQGVVSSAEGTIELLPTTGLEDAVSDLEGFERIFVIFHFHEAGGFRPRVQPPRSAARRGVLATRSPHRPNAIGLTIVRLLGVEGRVLRIADVDMLDGTPVLDIKPYVPYVDAFPASRSGWLEEEARDPIQPFEVRFAPEAAETLDWLASRGQDLRDALSQALALGPQPHAYRRIRDKGDHSEIALKDFRATFVADARTLTVTSIYSGYSPRDIATGKAPALHAELTSRRR